MSDRALHVVRDDGTVHTLDRTTRELLRTDRRCGRVAAVASLPWLGDVRLLLATEDGPVCCVGADDPVVTQYVSPHRGLKVVAAGGGYVAGVSGDRQRLVLWHAWDGRRPIAEVHVGAQARHRVALPNRLIRAPELSKSKCSESAQPNAWTTAPSIWPRNCIGLTTTPASAA